MNNVWPVLVGGGLGAIGTFMLGATGFLKFLVGLVRSLWRDRATAAHQQQLEAQTASSTVLTQALDLANALSAQVKDLRSENASLEQHQLDETRALRERIRNLETRMSEMEAELEAVRGENTWLKAQLYDQRQHSPTPKTPRSPSSSKRLPTPIRAAPLTPRTAPAPHTPRASSRRPPARQPNSKPREDG